MLTYAKVIAHCLESASASVIDREVRVGIFLRSYRVYVELRSRKLIHRFDTYLNIDGGGLYLHVVGLGRTVRIRLPRDPTCEEDTVLDILARSAIVDILEIVYGEELESYMIELA